MTNNHMQFIAGSYNQTDGVSQIGRGPKFCYQLNGRIYAPNGGYATEAEAVEAFIAHRARV